MTGWRLGYVTADAKWMGAMGYFHDLTYVCAPSALQHGAAAGLEQLPPAFYQQLAADHQSKRERIVSALRDAGMEPSVPAGAYYVLAKAERLAGRNLGAEGTASAGARPASPLWPDRRSSVPAAAKICCASALPRRTPTSMRPARG